ncbi:variable large family protein [Borrelia duttonii]
MVMMIVMGCNSGGVKGEGTGGGGGRGLSRAMMEVGRSAERAFYAFIELVADTLGFKVTQDTKRSDVAGYFDSLGGKLGEASEELEKVAKKAMIGVDKSDESKNPIRIAVDTAKEILSSLKTHLESLKGIGDDNKVVGVTSQQDGVAVNADALKIVYKALKGIVETAKAQQVKELNLSSVTLSQASLGVASPENGTKVLATGAAGAAVGDKAVLIVSAVSGEGMLESIVKSKDTDVKALGAAAVADTTPLEFAVGGTADNVANANAKAASVAGGIALRSLVKGGKLASHSTNNDEKAVQSAGITAVNKLLVAVEDIIKKTVKNVLEKVKAEVDKARDPKAVGQQ